MGHLSESLGHADRHAGLRGYCTGLMSPLSRKSVEPMAAHVDPLKVRLLARRVYLGLAVVLLGPALRVGRCAAHAGAPARLPATVRA